MTVCHHFGGFGISTRYTTRVTMTKKPGTNVEQLPKAAPSYPFTMRGVEQARPRLLPEKNKTKKKLQQQRLSAGQPSAEESGGRCCLPPAESPRPHTRSFGIYRCLFSAEERKQEVEAQ